MGEREILYIYIYILIERKPHTQPQSNTLRERKKQRGGRKGGKRYRQIERKEKDRGEGERE